MSDWHEVNLGDVVDFINGDRGKNYPSQSDRVPVGVPFVNAGDLVHGHIAYAEAEKITTEAFNRLSRGKTIPNDLLFCLRGSPGRVARDRKGGCAIASSLVIIRPGESIDREYLYFLLSGPAFQADCATLNNGSAQPNVSVRSLSELSFSLPPFDEQRAIAAVLGSLDDKIELNRRMNRTLEQMAAAIFKAWFVDFEPVRAKASGAVSFPGMPQPVFDSLPATFADSKLGPVPEGWEAKRLPNIIEVNPKRSLKKGEAAPHLDMKNMPTQGHAPEAWGERPFGSGMKFINGDTLVARITPCLENGKTALVDFLEDGLVGWGSTEYIVLRPKPPLPEVYAYCLARTDDFRDFAIQNMTGTSGRQRVPATALDHYPLVRPDETTAKAFGEIVEPLFTLIRSNMDESRSLAEARDALLPKLLSGEVRVAVQDTAEAVA